MFVMIKLYFYIAIDCGDLFDVFNGHVLLTGTTVTSVATYSCNIGFELIGKSTRECLGTGQWSGKDPQCKREYDYIKINGDSKDDFSQNSFHHCPEIA